MSARGRATIGLAVCAIATAATALRAGAVWRARGADPGEAAKLDSRAVELRERVEAVLAADERPLQAEVVRAAHLPGLRAAVADRVDAATILDLFDTEDWWEPFKARDAAIVSSDRLVTIRGDKELTLPTGLISRAAEAGVGVGVVAGAHPVLAAVAPIAPLKRAEATYLILMSPFDLSTTARELGTPIALSDGRRLVATSDPQRNGALLGLVGKENPGRSYDRTTGQLAIAIPTSGSLWLWALQEGSVPPAPSSGFGIWLGATALFGLGLLVFWRGRLRAAAPLLGPDAAEAPPAVEATGPALVPPLVPPTGSPFPPAVQTGPGPARGAERVETRLMSDSLLGHRPTEALASRTAAAPAIDQKTLDQNTFGRYHLLRRLDGGGMADIYTAVLHGAEGFRRVYVIKRLRPELARSRVAVEQFIDEAKLGSMLVHSNIVPVFDFGKVGDEYFMAQEYIIGRDLGRLLMRHVETTGRPLPEKLMFYIAHEVLDALGYAHAQTDENGSALGLVHRDVSPSNVMVTARGEVKLFDFGIVKATQRVSKTEVGVVKGNVSFMSPEQARGQPVDPRSDLFSLGLVMHHSLTNTQLYLGESTFDQLLRAATGPKTEQLRMLAGLPTNTAAILMRALAVDPNDRYQTAAEFAAALAPHVAGGKFEAAALMQTLFGEEFRNAAIE
jgi:tRNA A-37 threonylcarbamoyl transferase component Bud32